MNNAKFHSETCNQVLLGWLRHLNVVNEQSTQMRANTCYLRNLNIHVYSAVVDESITFNVRPRNFIGAVMVIH